MVGFFFHLVWAAAQGMWGIAFATLVGVFVGLLAFAELAQFAPAVAGAVALVAELALFSFYGLRGNQWLERLLERRGYLAGEQVKAASRSAAEELAQLDRSAV